MCLQLQKKERSVNNLCLNPSHFHALKADMAHYQRPLSSVQAEGGQLGFTHSDI